MSESSWFFPRGSLSRNGWETVVDQQIPNWQHTGLRIGTLVAGEEKEIAASEWESLVIPLSGTFEVTYQQADGTGGHQPLLGRASVFASKTDVLFLGKGSSFTLRGEGTLAVAQALASSIFPAQYLPASDIPLELRGTGASSRQVHNFGTPGTLEADSLIACEVITPANNWSSYPPHKHDFHQEGLESALEEIYFFETQPTSLATTPPDAGNEHGFGTFMAYSSDQGEIDINTPVHSGDVALVPHGYHGPAAAPPGYDLYYLNVMAGPGPAREWLIQDDPRYSWVRETWKDSPVDPRLPLGSHLKD